VFDSIPEALVVLDAKFRIIAASRAFRSIYAFDETKPNGISIFELFGKKWDLPALRQLLRAVAVGEADAVHSAIEHEPVLGDGTTLFSARRLA
jgi:PAS domain-containing protein